MTRLTIVTALSLLAGCSSASPWNFSRPLPGEPPLPSSTVQPEVTPIPEPGGFTHPHANEPAPELYRRPPKPAQVIVETPPQ